MREAGGDGVNTEDGVAEDIDWSDQLIPDCPDFKTQSPTS